MAELPLVSFVTFYRFRFSSHTSWALFFSFTAFLLYKATGKGRVIASGNLGVRSCAFGRSTGFCITSSITSSVLDISNLEFYFGLFGVRHGAVKSSRIGLAYNIIKIS